MNTILGWFLPLVLGPASKFIYDLIEKWVPFLEAKLPTWLKPIAVAILSFGVVALSKLLTVSVPSDILQWQATDVTALVTALVAYITHNAKKIAAITPPVA